VAASLTVENTAARTSEVYCAISEFRKADGTGLTFRAPLEVEPIEFSLNPGETRSVALRLHLSPEIFAPNQNYTGTLIINQNKQSILVLLTARATAAKPEKAKASVVTAAPERPLLVTAVRPRRTGRKTRKNPQKKKRNRKGS
jgi:hypothetical protein